MSTLNTSDYYTKRGQIVINDSNNNPVIAMTLTATMARGNNITVQAEIADKTLIDANATEVQTQIDQFRTEVKTKAQELGYTICI